MFDAFKVGAGLARAAERQQLAAALEQVEAQLRAAAAKMEATAALEAETAATFAERAQRYLDRGFVRIESRGQHSMRFEVMKTSRYHSN